MPNTVLRDKAIRLVEDAIYSKGCMCDACQQGRINDVLDIAYETVYPGLKVKPARMMGTWKGNIKYLHDLRWGNKDILKEIGDKDYLYCDHCGVVHVTDDSYQHGDTAYCGTCWESMFECSRCGKLHEKRLQRWVHKGANKVPVCIGCLQTHYKRCALCDDYVRKDTKLQYINGRAENGELIVYHLCPFCRNRGKVKCHGCGAETNTGFAYRMGEYHYCAHCKEMEMPVHPYFFKPIELRWQRHDTEGKVSDNAFHMGFELEVARYSSFIDCKSMSHMVKDLVGKDKMYCVKDGTIQRGTGFDGVEFVSHPFTWQDYKKRGADRWDDLLVFLRKNGYKANLAGIGFHVHTTKAAWGPHQLYKLLKFIYSNQKFVVDIAQREPNDYCLMSEEDFNEAVLVAKDKKNRKPQHYNTINLNSGDNSGRSAPTIEFRMFQGTLEPLYFHKNIEFVKACYEFTNTFSAENMNKAVFLVWLQDRKRKYPCLSEYIKMKGVK